MQATENVTCPHCRAYVPLKGCYNCKHYVRLWENAGDRFEPSNVGFCLRNGNKALRPATLPCKQWAKTTEWNAISV